MSARVWGGGIVRIARIAQLTLLVGAMMLAVTAVTQAQDDDANKPHGNAFVTKSSGRCGVCHPSERVAFEKSRHAGEDMRCTTCHGGNDQSVDQASAHSNGFKGRISRGDIPASCASCHSDQKMMRPYDLPIDQMALYQTSGHGLKLKAGDTKVAVCSDCHGAHDVLAASDPACRTYVTNIPRTCGNCHGDSLLMAPRHQKDAYHDYLKSVHAKELFDKGDLRAPTCVSCHGVHGATPTQVGDVNKVCGRCHTAERRYFLAGPHAAGMAKKGMSECASCHLDHATQAGATERLASGCVPCHAKGSKEDALGAQLLADYKNADLAVTKAEEQIGKADGVPLQTDDYHSRVEEARTYLREAMTAAHAVKPEVMAAFTARARSVGTEVDTEIQHKLTNILVEKVALVVFWFYVLMTIGIIRRWRDRGPKA
jgi:hypothetical protein